jgi:transposase-like protein
LTEIEDLALDLRQAIGEKATQVLAEATEAESVPGPACPTCGEEMHTKGKKRRRVVTRSGEVELERSSYYCEGCQQGFFPPG